MAKNTTQRVSSILKRYKIGIITISTAILLSTATIKAADRAVPGDILYPIDRLIESIDLSLTRSSEAKLTKRLQILKERISELQLTGDKANREELITDITEEVQAIHDMIGELENSNNINTVLYRNSLRAIIDSAPLEIRQKIEQQIQATARTRGRTRTKGANQFGSNQAHGPNQRRTTSTKNVHLTGDIVPLTDDIVKTMKFMREEEKLARDVYLALYEKWGERVFQNIAQSEQRHMDAMKKLLEAYKIEDPAQPERGTFTNPQLQELYDQLIERGSKSIEEALKVGALIEEVDINDLDQALKMVPENSNIASVYRNLRDGSYNHLRAFTQRLRSLGEAYKAQVLSEERVAEILQDQGQTGHPQNNNRGRGRNNW